jgi:predicted RNase H-like HicB family nuclease
MTEPTARYRINLFWPAEDGCRVADVPDLRFCAAFGETPEAAAPEAQVAVQARLASAAARSHNPEPPGHLRSASDGVGQWLKGEVSPKATGNL